MGRVKRSWYLSPMRAPKVQASLPIRAVSPEPLLLAHTSSESRGTFRQKARSLAPLNGWACAVKICHDGMLEDTNSLDGAHIIVRGCSRAHCLPYCQIFNTRDFAIRNTSWPLMGPLTLLREVTLLSLYSVLSKCTFKTNKHNHYSEIKGGDSRNDNWKYKMYKNFGILAKGRH